MPTDPEADAVGPFGDDGVVQAATAQYKALRVADKPWLVVAGVTQPARRMTTRLLQGLTRLSHLLRERRPTGIPANAKVALIRGWVRKDGSSTDDTLRAHWEARGADIVLSLPSGDAPTPEQLAALQALAADARVGLGYTVIRDEPFGNTTRNVLHVSVTREASDRLTELVGLDQRVPDKPEFVSSDPSTGALRDGPAGPVASNLLVPYPQGTGAGRPRATREVVRRLVELRYQVQREWAQPATLRVERAWRDEDPGPDATFFGEGRAAAVIVTPAGSTGEARLSRLGRLAAHTGFPYVNHRQAGDGLPEHIYVSTNDTRSVWGLETAAAERILWQDHAAGVERFFDFWNNFLSLKQGGSVTAIDEITRFRFLTIIRAVSWQESRHGTVPVTNTHPVRSVMQSGHPADGSWASLSTQVPSVESVALPDGRRARLWELPALAALAANFPDEADVGRLREPKNGHKDPNYTPAMSFFWGTLFLLFKVNSRRGMRVNADINSPKPVSDCGDGSWAHVVGGAGDYNARISQTLEHTKYYLEFVSEYVFFLILGVPRLTGTPGHLLVTAAGEPQGLGYWAWDGAVHQQRRSKFGGQFTTDDVRRPSVAFAAQRNHRVVALVEAVVTFDGTAHRLTLRFPYFGGDWLLHYDGIESSLVSNGATVAAGQPIGVVRDRGQNAQGRPLTRVELRMVPVNAPTASPWMDVMDPVVAAGWTNLVAFNDTSWFPNT